MAIRIKTNYPGIYYREVERRGKSGLEKVYYIVFKKNGKVIEEKVGKQYEDGMTPAKANTIRGERIEGKRLSRKEIRKKEIEKRKAELNKWTIERLWNEYKTQHPDLKGFAQDQNRFKNYIQSEFGKKEPKELSSFNVDKFRINLLKIRKPGTVKNIIELLRRIIIFGVKKQLCDGVNFVIQMPKVNNQKTEDLTPEQLARLLKVLDEEENIQIANIMKLVLYTGMRRGEVLKLKWSDINFEREKIIIREPKGGVNQTIPLNEKAKEIIINNPRTESEFIFPGKNGKQRVDIKRQVNRIKEKAELPKDFRALHGLRHVYASTLASSGVVDLYTLQTLLTHKSPIMTQRYAHLRDEALKKASDLGTKLIDDHAKDNLKLNRNTA